MRRLRRAKPFQWKALSQKQMQTLVWWSPQSAFYDYDGIIDDGAIRSGKTVTMGFSFVSWAMTCFDGESFALCGKTIASLRRNVLGVLKQQLLGRGYEVIEHRADNFWEVSKGDKSNEFYFFGGKDESSQDLIQGITLAGAFFDEVALMPESFVNQATARCSITGSKYWFNCNPAGPQHWFYQKWILRCKKRRLVYLHFTMEDNLTLDEHIKERYRNQYTGVFYNRYILGLWVKAEGLVYPMFSRDKHIVHEEIPYNPRHRYYVSIDYGTHNPFAAGLWDYDPVSHRAIMMRELYYKGGSANRVDNEAYYKMLRELARGFKIEYIIIDPSASSMVETIQKYAEWLVVKADNDVLNGIQDVTKYINMGLLLFHESCKATFREFEQYSWDEDSDEDAVIKEFDHSMDQVRYFCRTALRAELKWVA